MLLSDHVRSDDGNDGVPQPVGSSGETNTTRADGKREDLANNDPGTRSPGGSEEEDEDGNESNLGVDSRDVVGQTLGGIIGVWVGVVESNSDTNDGAEELADQHTSRSVEKDCASTPFLDRVERDGSGADVDQSEDEGDQEGVADGTSGLKERCGVVEDEVDTSPLLHHLERGTENGAAQVGLLMPETTLEAVQPALEPASIGNHGALVLFIGHNLGQLDLNVFGLAGLTSEFGEGNGGIFESTLLDEVSRRIWEEEKTAAKNEGPGELDGNGDSVGTGIGSFLSGVDDNGSQHDTDGDAELVTGNESTSDLSWALEISG